MANTLRVLCVHGVGDHRNDLRWQNGWETAIRKGVDRWNPNRKVDLRFVFYEDLFEKASLGLRDTLNALRKLLGSGIHYGISDLFRRRRGLFDIPERLRWTAGMVVQWAENEPLREETRRLLLGEIDEFEPDVVAAHSLGSLICYDTLIRHRRKSAIKNTRFISFGSQIGNPFVRGTFGGRLVAPAVKTWYHLYNKYDDVFTAPIHIDAPSFQQIEAHFDLKGFGDHAATAYLSHDNVVDCVWGQIVGGRPYRAFTKSEKALVRLSRTPNRRALLVGINEYPDEADRLEGCVNDVFLVSSVLQECGFEAEDIRVALDDRATADGIRERLQWLLESVRDGDQRVFDYSGHGAQIHGYGVGETVDRLDECLVPCDFDWSLDRAIIDDELYELYSQLPYNARLVMILDCCHSGGMTRDGGPRVRGLDPPDDIRHRALKWSSEHDMWVPRELELPNRSLTEVADGKDYVGSSGVKRRLGRAVGLRALPNNQYDNVRKQLRHHGPYLPVIYQACQEDEYAYEYRHGVTSYGAFTYSMAKTLRKHKARRRSLTFEGLVKAVTKTLETLRYDQTPALVGPKPLRNTRIPW
jgi:hypothetical protein